jgi:S-adenosylmethionine:tRNA ribosyltransferase-isomerase
MQVSDFEFELPEHLIAQYPTTERTASRLLHLDATSGAVSHYHFRDLPSLLAPEDLMACSVLNRRVVELKYCLSES